jgi:hypothetical protein
MTSAQRRRRQGRPDNQGTPFTIAPLSPNINHPNTQQMTATRTLFGEDVSARGGFPEWESDDVNVATVSDPNDADGDGVVEDAGGLVTSVGAGAADISAVFPGVTSPVTDVDVTV